MSALRWTHVAIGVGISLVLVAAALSLRAPADRVADAPTQAQAAPVAPVRPAPPAPAPAARPTPAPVEPATAKQPAPTAAVASPPDERPAEPELVPRERVIDINQALHSAIVDARLVCDASWRADIISPAQIMVDMTITDGRMAQVATRPLDDIAPKALADCIAEELWSARIPEEVTQHESRRFQKIIDYQVLD